METKILAIGNSFSEDATYYLHQLTKAARISTRVVNLYIGGCSLERHWQNMESGEAAYPVSYTHLDVYKRQAVQSACPTSRK